jgi:hypothetical protein
MGTGFHRADRRRGSGLLRYALGDLDRALAAGAWLYAVAEAAVAHVIETMVCSVGSSHMMR